MERPMWLLMYNLEIETRASTTRSPFNGSKSEEGCFGRSWMGLLRQARPFAVLWPSTLVGPGRGLNVAVGPSSRKVQQLQQLTFCKENLTQVVATIQLTPITLLCY